MPLLTCSSTHDIILCISLPSSKVQWSIAIFILCIDIAVSLCYHVLYNIQSPPSEMIWTKRHTCSHHNDSFNYHNNIIIILLSIILLRVAYLHGKWNGMNKKTMTASITIIIIYLRAQYTIKGSLLVHILWSITTSAIRLQDYEWVSLSAVLMYEDYSITM